MADHPADGIVSRVVRDAEFDGVDGLAPWLRRFGFKKWILGIVRGEQGLKALAQGRVAVAGDIEEGGAFGARQLGGGLEQGGLTLRIGLHFGIGSIHLLIHAWFAGKKYVEISTCHYRSGGPRDPAPLISTRSQARA
jgi:hypothetical protein